MMSNIEVTIVINILVIITSIIIYSAKTRILHKNENGECLEKSLEEVIQFLVPNNYHNVSFYKAENFLKKI